MDQRTRKLMTMHKARNDVDRQSVSRKGGGKGLASIKDCVDASIQRLKYYIEKYGGRLITATRNHTDNASIKWTKIIRKQKWEEKQTSGHFKRQTNEITQEKNLDMAKKVKPKGRN